MESSRIIDRAATTMNHRSRHLRRTCFALILAILAFSLFYLGMTRWNGRPAYLARMMEDAPRKKLSTELADAIAAIPPLPKMELPPAPEGMQWSKAMFGLTVEVGDALEGPWEPNQNPHQFTLAKFVNDPVTSQALDRLTDLPPLDWEWNGFTISTTNLVGRLIAFRARCKREQLHDVDGALKDLRRLMRFADSISRVDGNSERYLSWWVQGSLSLGELQRLAFSHSISATALHEWQRLLNDEFADPHLLFLGQINAMHEEFMTSIDRCYTCDENGDGWLVLSSLPNSLIAANATRSGIWNVLSPIYNDRRQVTDKLARVRDRLLHAASLPFPEGLAHLQSAPLPRFTILDGPGMLGDAFADVSPFLLRAHWGRVANRNASIAALAISHFKALHGRLPAELADLAPGILDRIPIDPFDGRPLRYRVIDDGRDFLLYSVGADLKDDSGRTRMGSVDDIDSGDVVFFHHSRPARFKIQLEPAIPFIQRKLD